MRRRLFSRRVRQTAPRCLRGRGLFCPGETAAGGEDRARASLPCGASNTCVMRLVGRGCFHAGRGKTCFCGNPFALRRLFLCGQRKNRTPCGGQTFFGGNRRGCRQKGQLRRSGGFGRTDGRFRESRGGAQQSATATARKTVPEIVPRSAVRCLPTVPAACSFPGPGTPTLRTKERRFPRRERSPVTPGQSRNAGRGGRRWGDTLRRKPRRRPQLAVVIGSAGVLFSAACGCFPSARRIRAWPDTCFCRPR